MKPFRREDLEEFVKRRLEKEQSPLSADDLVDALVENNVTSGRLVSNACDLYVSGSTAEEASQVEGITSVSSLGLIRSIGSGDWAAVRKELKKASASDARLLRAAVIGYLNVVLLDAAEVSDRTKAVAEAIKRLSYVAFSEDQNQFAALAAEVYTLTEIFGEYRIT